MQTLKTKIRIFYKKFVLVFAAGMTLTILVAPSLALAASDPCHPENDTPPGTALPADAAKACDACATQTGLSAADLSACQSCSIAQPDLSASPSELKGCESCSTGKDPTAAELSNCLKQNPIIGDLNIIINFLSAGAGIVIVGSIIVGGIQYSMAGSNVSAVSAAKKRIVDALIALLVFFFIFAFLQWLIPGGLLFS